MLTIFVGDEPSKLNTNQAKAFVGAECNKRLDEWISYLGLNEKQTLKINSKDTVDLGLIKYAASDKNNNVVALGNLAAKRLKMADIRFYRIDHPSGLNSKVNDKAYEKKMLDECKEWLNRGLL